MPGIWEAQMYREGEKWEMLEEKPEWDDITVSCLPCSLVQALP